MEKVDDIIFLDLSLNLCLSLRILYSYITNIVTTKNACQVPFMDRFGC